MSDESPIQPPTSGVRARFYLASVTRFPGQPGGEVKLQAVSRGDRNAGWATATPSGTITMMVNDPGGFAWFVQLLEAKQAGTVRYPEVDLLMTVADQVSLGDGHAFTLANVKPDHYLHGKCGLCGYEAERH